MVNKPLLIHIHSDAKFVSEIKNYSSHHFNNKLIFLGTKDSAIKKDYKSILIKSSNNLALSEMASICSKADMVILYNLTEININLVLKLPKNVIILWRFFGTEIYSKETDLVLSKASKIALGLLSKEMKIKLLLAKYIFWYKHYKFKKAVHRINYFMGLMDDEYKLLNNLGYKLPPFIQIPLQPYNTFHKVLPKSPYILLGNSRNSTNNHIDILNLIKNINLPKELKIKIFFSYGAENSYSNKVKTLANEIDKAELIEDFLDKNEFIKLYKNTSAFIFNGYRQMAMGNIFIALSYGVKVYLSEKNVTYNWLLKKHFKIFSIENNLKMDIENNHITLSQEEINHNIEMMHQLYNNNAIDIFNENLLKIANR